MKMRKFAVTAALVAAAVGVAAGTATAAPPATAPKPAAPTVTNLTPGVHATAKNGVNYAANIEKDGTAVITTDAGTLVNDHGIFKIKAADGHVLAGTPLAFRIDQFEFPVHATINGNRATLTPVLDVNHAVYKPVALPFEDQAPWKTPYDREVAAFTRLKDTVATGATFGTMTGLIGGGVIGCVLGATVGAVVTGILAELFGAGPIAGCLAGIPIGAGIGALAGAIIITAPVGIAGLAQYLITTNQPFVPAPSSPQRVIVVEDPKKSDKKDDKKKK